MNCPFCGTENTDDSLYCKKCGRKMSGTVTCPACGASAPADGEYCTRCGAKLNTHAPAQVEREKPHPAAWRQVLVTVGNALAVFAALASVIFLFCLGCENGITDTGDMWLDLSGRNIYYYFGEVYRDLYNIFTTSTPVLVGTAGYTFAIAGTLLSAGMIVSVSVLFILTLVRFVRSFSGKGGSVTAILNGKSYDTSMGFSPLDGLVMGTRCGNVDASAITFIGEKEGMSFSEINAMMNKRSGVLGLTGISSDMRDIDAAYEAGNRNAIIARDMYYTRVKKFVGAYAAEMGGVDLLIFTGGVGENSFELRSWVCSGMEFMGIRIDEAVNRASRGVDAILSTPESRVKVATIATNEELVIATDTYELTKDLK